MSLLTSDNSSDPIVFHCSMSPDDTVEARRVGQTNNTDSVVAVNIATDEAFYDGDQVTSTILLTRQDARRLAVALIEFADQCDGKFTGLLPISLHNPEDLHD